MKTKDIDLLAKLALSPLSAAIALAAVIPSTQAATFLVEDIEDDEFGGGLSFNEALQASMENDEDDLIEFSSALDNATISMSGVYAYEEEGEGSTGTLTIDGSGAENLTVKMFEGEGDVGFLSFNSSISINDLNIVIDNDDGAESKYESTVFLSAYGDLNLERVSITQADTNQANSMGVFSKYSSVDLKDVVIDGAGEGEGLWGMVTSRSDVTIDGATFNDLQMGVFAFQYAEGGSLESKYQPGVMDISISNSTFSGISNEGEGAPSAAIVAFAHYSEGCCGPEPIRKGLEKVGNVGGGLLNLSITNSTLSDNGQAIAAGTPDFADYARVSVDISNSTIVGNEKYYGGAALEIYGNADLNMTHTTITNNTSGEPEEDADPAVIIDQYYGSELSISNSIIAGNTATKYIDEATGFGFDAADIMIQGANEGEGSIVSSLIGKDVLDDGPESYNFGEGVIYDEAPLFNEGGLKYNNDASVATLCLTSDSPAVDSADAGLTKIAKLGLDQTGADRLADDGPDMGAVEYSEAACADSEPAPKKKKKKSDSGLFGSFGSLTLASLFSLAFFRRKKY